MRSRPSRSVGVLVCALALAAPVTVTTQAPALAGTDLPQPTDDGPRVPRRWQHSSDGVRGEIARPLPAHLRGQSRTTSSTTWQAAPGVTVTKWDETTPRGPIRAQLMTVALGTRGLAVDYAYAGEVRRTAPLTRILARHDAIAGVNGDFFDIGDTGAPLGLGRDRQEGVLNARAAGWNSAFFIDKAGRPDIGTLPMRARIRQHPRLRVTNVNSAEVQPGGIGAYTRDWGPTSGYRVTGGQRKRVRMVVIRKHRVVQVRRKLTSGDKIRGTLLIGRGKGARDLAPLRKGRKVNVRWWLAGTAKTAITGNKVLIDDGVIDVVDDREMHPRTAVGIDRDNHQLLFLVVDGRQSFSRGYTMVELANRMADLGADEALNLDGGGSSTMVARNRFGNVRVINSPSDGSQRSVPNGIEIRYRR